jgi:hypothetical protein
MIKALDHDQMFEFLMNVAPVRTVYIKGPPGGGKSSLVKQFCEAVGLELVTLYGASVLPEDIIGLPYSVDGATVFHPPQMFMRTEPICLFLDEFADAKSDTQKVFYSIVLEHRTISWSLPKGSIVVCASNRAQDNALVNPLPAPLVGRVIQVELSEDVDKWLVWGHSEELHPWVLAYIEARKSHLRSAVSLNGDPFSSPRSWHMASDGLKAFGFGVKEDLSLEMLDAVMLGAVKAEHAVQFKAFVKQMQGQFDVSRLLKGDVRWPDKPQDSDLLYFLAHSFRDYLVKELPSQVTEVKGKHKELAHTAKALIKELARINIEIAQKVMAEDDNARLPSWFLTEVVRDLPRLAARAA